MCHFVIIGGKYAGSLETILENMEMVSKNVGGRPLAVFLMKPWLEDLIKLTKKFIENAIPLVRKHLKAIPQKCVYKYIFLGSNKPS